MAAATPTTTPVQSVKTYVRCKACGFVIEESKLGEVCPACGVKRAMFQPDTEKVSEQRRRILDAHIHPIIVHFTQAFAASAFVMCLMHVAVPVLLAQHVWHTLQVVCVCLPFTGIAALVSGRYDGKVRFRKLTAPLLKRKMLWGSVFALAAMVLAAVAVVTPADNLVLGAALTLFSLVCFVCSIVLGRIGASLTNAKFAG